jgi:hypothetical protein
MKLAGGARDALGQDARLFVHENRHGYFGFWILDFGFVPANRTSKCLSSASLIQNRQSKI